MKKEVEFFDKSSESYLAEYEKKTPEGYSFRVRREKVLAMLQEAQEEKTALDIGCGPGIMIDGLLGKNYRVHCIDAAPKMIDLVNKKYASSPLVKANVDDVNKLNFPDDSFDVVLGMGLLEYLEDQERAVKEITRVTKNDGNIILTFPNKTSPWRICNRIMLVILKPFIKIYKYIFKKPSHPIKHKEYTTKKTTEFLEKFGLKVEEVIFYNFKLIPYPFDKIFPKLAIWQSKLFEKLDKGSLKFIGTGFIVKAKKTHR